MSAIALLGLAATTAVTSPGVASASTTPKASSICSKVPASAISAIVGYSVPAGQLQNLTLPATKTNYETSSKETSCTYGSEKSLATLSKLVILTLDTTSKVITPAEAKASLAKLASDGIKMTITSYPGLGGTAYYFTETTAGITAEGLSVFNGTHGWGASLESKTLSAAKLAQLAKLAATL